jgi:hypothetical protein
MPLSPENAPEEAVLPGEASARPRRWKNRLLGFSFAIFALEIGLFLLIFPWTDVWNLNYFRGSVPALQDVWDETYFRGAITSIGLLNIYVACLETLHLLRRS